MQLKVNFKSGFITGCLLGIIILAYGYHTFQKVKNKAKNVANIELYQLEYQDLDGNKVMLSDFEGQHILLNFWATWCLPCVKEFPVLNDTYNILNDDFVFVMVSDQSIDKIKAFAEAKPYNFVYAKTNNLILNGITTVPQTFVLDKNGIVKQHHPTIFEGSPESIADTLISWVKN